jgi:cytochrome oxidase assembly protein ShyY1
MLQVIYVLVFNTCVALLGRFILVKLGLWQVSSEEAKQQKLKEERRARKEAASFVSSSV